MAPQRPNENVEKRRLEEDRLARQPWKKWGPYLNERQWGTVREDYSPNGDAWHFFPHDHACSQAFRWGEDGIAGVSDDEQRLCLALFLWNGRDPILKERLSGLTTGEGNHGEDVKELCYYLTALQYKRIRPEPPRADVALDSAGSEITPFHFMNREALFAVLKRLKAETGPEQVADKYAK
jgi:hypothetical protein